MREIKFRYMIKNMEQLNACIFTLKVISVKLTKKEKP